MPNLQELLKILVCPKCRGQLAVRNCGENAAGFECQTCAVVYPIRDDIPVMLVEEAIPLAKWTETGGE